MVIFYIWSIFDNRGENKWDEENTKEPLLSRHHSQPIDKERGSNQKDQQDQFQVQDELLLWGSHDTFRSISLRLCKTFLLYAQQQSKNRGES